MNRSGLLRRLALDVTPLRASRDFRLVFSAAGISGFGSFITNVTVPYQVYELTKDPLLVGLLGICELVPLLFMAFVGGALRLGQDVTVRPSTTPASISVQGPWQIAPTGLCASSDV